MAGIDPSSATTATLLTHLIIFVMVSVFNFTIEQELPINIYFGISLAILSLVSLLLGITSQDQDENSLRSVLLTTSAMWTSLAVFHIIQFFTDASVNVSEALFPGYISFALFYFSSAIGALRFNDKYTAVIAVCMFVSCIFKMIALAGSITTGVSIFCILAILILFKVLQKLWLKFRRFEHISTSFSIEKRSCISKDFTPVAHGMNVLAASVFAGYVTETYESVNNGHAWVVTAGFYQIVFAILAVRRSDIYHGIYFFFHGLFWFTNGFSLTVAFATDKHIPCQTAVTAIFVIVFATIAAVSLTTQLFQMIHCITVSFICISILVDEKPFVFTGVTALILFILSLYSTAAHISRVENSACKFPLGVRLITLDKIKTVFMQSFKCWNKKIKNNLAGRTPNTDLFTSAFTLGYSRYSGFDVAGFAINAISAASLIWAPEGIWILPWSVIVGGLSNMVIGSICFAKGLSFESCAFYVFGSVWFIWGSVKGFGTLKLDNSPAVISGLIGFLAVGFLLFGLSSVINKAWGAVTFTFNLVLIGILLRAINANGAPIYETITIVLFVIVCVYCFLAFAMKDIWGHEILPLGQPLLQVSYLHSQGQDAFWADGRKANGVRAIADILNRGGICGIPTDVVYVLIAAMKFPEAVKRAYLTKKEAEDRPMSLWISKVDQIDSGRELFGELLWGLMNEIWPSTVSLVVPKGDWYTNLGAEESGHYVGRPDSIALRMPDNTVTSHLIDQTGPVAVSSANPTGEADTTHHLQVLSKLGLKNVDGILCSGPSPENMASTVVDCRHLHEGKLGFFRIGVVPRSHVEAALAKVKAYKIGSILPDISMTRTAQTNLAFESEESDVRRAKNGDIATTESNSMARP